MNRRGKPLLPRVFSVAALAAAIALAVAAGHSPAARGSAAEPCPSLRNVVAFDGRVSETFGEAFSGADGGDGTLTIQLGRVARNVHIHLADKRHPPTGGATYYLFSGRTSGGHVSIDDVYEDTGSDYAGELKYENTVSPHSGGGTLVIDRRSCTYKLNVGFVFAATYTGDPEVDRGHLVTFGAATSPDAHIFAPSLALHGAALFRGPLAPGPACDPALADACAYLYSAWMPEVIELYECGTIDLTDCSLADEDPHFKTPATFNWTLKPVYKKGT